MKLTNRAVVALSAAILMTMGLTACSDNKPVEDKSTSTSTSQSQQESQNRDVESGGVPAASDVLSDRLISTDNGDGTVTYTYASAIITTPSTSNQPKESNSEVSWGMTVDVSSTMTVSMSLVKPVDGQLSVESYSQQIASTVGGSQITNVKVKGAKSANKVILGDGRSVTVVATNGSTILIGSAVSSDGDIFAAEKIVDTMRFGE